MFPPKKGAPPKGAPAAPKKKPTPELMKAQAAALRKPKAAMDEEPEENPSKPPFMK